MSGGRIAELGGPHELLQNEEGLFTQMVRSTGDTQAQELYRLATESKMLEEPKLHGQEHSASN